MPQSEPGPALQGATLAALRAAESSSSKVVWNLLRIEQIVTESGAISKSQTMAPVSPARLGVLGGTFNPVHIGHLHIAREIHGIFGLSRVIFVVAGTPPHKPLEDLISFHHRYAMVSLATSGCGFLLPSQIELEPPASPYSIDTLTKLAKQCSVSGNGLYFIAGGDSLLEVAGWHRSQELLSACNFVFVMRPGIPVKDAFAALPQAEASRVVDLRGFAASRIQNELMSLPTSAGSHIFLLDVNAPEIAASQIRRRLTSGQAIDDLVPASVSEYIRKLHLYGE